MQRIWSQWIRQEGEVSQSINFVAHCLASNCAPVKACKWTNWNKWINARLTLYLAERMCQTHTLFCNIDLFCKTNTIYRIILYKPTNNSYIDIVCQRSYESHGVCVRWNENKFAFRRRILTNKVYFGGFVFFSRLKFSDFHLCCIYSDWNDITTKWKNAIDEVTIF